MHDGKEFLRGWPAPARLRGGRVAFAVAVLLAAGACEGENLFDEDGNGIGKPAIVELIAPDSVEAGRFVDLEVHATGERRIEQFELQLRGAVERDSLVGVTAPLDDVNQTISFVVEPPIQDTLLEVTVRAIDQTGSKSDPVSDTVRVRDVTGPSLDGVAVDPTATGAGETVSISIEAADNIGLTSLGYAVLDADGDTIFSELAPVAGSKSDSLLFQYIVPLSTPPGPLAVVGLATDQAGLLGASAPVALTIEDRSEPAVEIQRPGGEATFPLGDSILVEFRVVDNAGISNASLVGVALRGDPDLGTGVEIVRFNPKTVSLPDLPQDTTLQRYLVATSDQTPEPVHLIVSATDGEGEVGTDTVVVSIGGPRVEIRSPEDGSVVRSAVSVTLFASDPSKIESLRLFVTGVISDTIAFAYEPPRDSVIERPVVDLPAVAGELTLRAEALSALGVPGRSTQVVLTVDPDAGGGATDEEPPLVGLEILPCDRIACERMEMTDSVRVRVTAEDNSVISRLGVTAIATNTANTDTATIQQDSVFATPVSGQPQVDFWFHPFNFDTLSLPDTLRIDIYAFAVDEAGNCAAAQGSGMQSAPCATFKGDTIAADLPGERVDAMVVAGRTVLLPGGGHIADAVMDEARRRLYLSNFSGYTVEVLDLTDPATPVFLDSVDVGSEPWGVSLNRTGDTLLVANSFGTTISYIELGDPLAPPAVLTESDRFVTPDIVLFQVAEIKNAEDGTTEYEAAILGGISDRPQFITQDAMGFLLYSTRPTTEAPVGTIRVADPDPDPASALDRPEAYLLFTGAAVTPSSDVTAIANIDDINVFTGGGSDEVEIIDHQPGFPATLITSGVQPDLRSAIDAVRAAGSDVVDLAGRWDFGSLGMSDTTFIATSGDRTKIAFGEGASGPDGQVMLWDAVLTSPFDGSQVQSALSSVVQVQDLTENKADFIRGLSLNLNGTLGAATGPDAVYFFNDELRFLVGVSNLPGGATGVALHPDHDTSSGSSDSTLAFIGTRQQTIKIVDTHFPGDQSEIHIRDNIAGPLRASLDLPGDNPGLTCPGDPLCVVVKLYGITSAGGVVVVNVRERDLP